MDVPDKPADPNEVELTEVDKKTLPEKNNQEQLIENINITFCTHVGWDGVLVLCCMLAISGLFLYITYRYTHWVGRNFGRKYVWIFPSMCGIYNFKLFLVARKWKRQAKRFTDDTTDDRNRMACYRKIIAIKNDFQLFGPYYLWKLYATELLESVIQLYNLFQVYLCSMPVEFSTLLCMFLAIDCFHSAQFMVRTTTVEGRDRQYKIDAFVDFFTTVTPICIIQFGYHVPIAIEEMLSITIFPALMLMLKLSTMFEEIIRSRSAKEALKSQTQCARHRERRRSSIFRNASHFTMVQQQEASVPSFVHVGAGVTKILFGIFFAVAGVLQLATHATECEQVLWNSCKVKTPFCGNIFHPTCNCAVLTVLEHNYTRLPEKDIKQMSALKHLKISHGPLQYVFGDFINAFPKLSLADFSYNMLTKIPYNFGMSKQLYKVVLSNNNLTSVPDSLWGNPFLHTLELDNNNITEISPAIRNAQTLQLLYMSNNSLSRLPAATFVNSQTKVTTMLNSVYLDGNHLKEIPRDIQYATSLKELGLNKNSISNVPREIRALKKLFAIDLRNNNITNLPTPSILALEKSLIYIYLHNNPICSNGWLDDEKDVQAMLTKVPDAGCTPQCSNYCQNRYLSTIKTCLRECNSKECGYQNGVCVQAE